MSGEGDALFFNETGDEGRSHGEIYLELANLDVNDSSAIAGFANKYSVLRGSEMYRRLRDTHLFTPYHRSGPSFPREQRLAHERAHSVMVWRDDLPVGTQIETLHEFRFAANIFATMVEAWRAVSTGIDRSAPVEPVWALARQVWQRQLLTEGLPGLLRSYTPTLSIRRLESESRYWQPPEIRPAPPVGVAPLYEVCAFELYNHIVRSATYHQCENESCRRLFVHQHGRAVHRQNRSRGVKYCSHQCAQAQNQRMYRRRKARRTHKRDHAATS